MAQIYANRPGLCAPACPHWKGVLWFDASSLEVKVLRALFELFEALFRQFADALARYLLDFLRYDLLSELLQMVGTVADEVFLEGEYRVRLADVAYLARFRERHEAVAEAVQ